MKPEEIEVNGVYLWRKVSKNGVVMAWRRIKVLEKDGERARCLVKFREETKEIWIQINNIVMEVKKKRAFA